MPAHCGFPSYAPGCKTPVRERVLEPPSRPKARRQGRIPGVAECVPPVSAAHSSRMLSAGPRCKTPRIQQADRSVCGKVSEEACWLRNVFLDVLVFGVGQMPDVTVKYNFAVAQNQKAHRHIAILSAGKRPQLIRLL